VIAAAYRDDVTGFPGGTTERRRFPALDPEPPPRPWWRRLLLPAAVLVLASAIVLAVRLWPLRTGAPPPAATGHSAAAGRRLGGRVLAVSAAGRLVTSDPDGRNPATVSGPSNVGTMAAVAPDHRYLSLFNGQVLALGHGPALTPASARVPLSSETSTAWPAPFADHERALVMLLDYGAPALSQDNPITVDSFATGRPVSLGIGDQVAGDPQAAGAFASVAAPIQPTGVSIQSSPDGRVVLRDAGRPAVLLATASALSRDLGHRRNLLVSLAPYPSPSGSEVAVTVRPATGDSDAGIVVLSRTGRLLGKVTASFSAQSAPAWSPTGRALAFPATGGNGAELTIWTIGHSPVTSQFPGSGSYGGCVWSPDEKSVLCAAADGGSWAIAPAAGGRMAAVHGPGLPLAWLPSAGSR
jgi:WD40 repeat protein